MAASSRIVDYVKHSSRPFIFSASITPASCASALTALRILKEHPELPETLQSRALFMRKQLHHFNIRMKESNGDMIPIIPIYTYKPLTTLAIAKELYDRGVYVNPSLPPATAGASIACGRMPSATV